MRLLLRSGANPGVENKNGKTPISIAKERGHELCEELVSEKGYEWMIFFVTLNHFHLVDACFTTQEDDVWKCQYRLASISRWWFHRFLWWWESWWSFHFNHLKAHWIKNTWKSFQFISKQTNKVTSYINIFLDKYCNFCFCYPWFSAVVTLKLWTHP